MVARVDRPFGAMRVSVGEWPLLIAEFPEKKSADEDVFAAFDYIEALMKDAALRREKVFFIADLTAVREVTPPRQRKFAADWAKRTANLSRAAAVGSATVTPSSILRGIITAVHWLNPPPVPTFSKNRPVCLLWPCR